MTREPASVRYVVVPGIWNSGDTHWQTLWERSWGDRAARIAPSSWEHPDRDDWVAAIDDAVRASAAAAPGSATVIVAHSLGCLAAWAWLEQHDVGGHDDAVRGALLVAPPDPDASAFPDDATGFGAPHAAVSTPVLLVASADDPFCAIDRARGFAATLGATFVDVGDLGHVNVASGLGAWPAGRDLLGRLLGEAADSSS
ncbi:RBBP9/YdeN family alpha/beta hydrolase [Curtobacterium sp. RRHDQ10]|uniref:RBBP9/YdeN family alpha/beta hydrolase n=1 Tax=Curtobacterium phyllosphaerae TaxID=3413379 RepID=UPI003BF27CEA